jgi:hypothetical protein
MLVREGAGRQGVFAAECGAQGRASKAEVARMTGITRLLAVLIDADNTAPKWTRAICEEMAGLGKAGRGTGNPLDLRLID